MFLWSSQHVTYWQVALLVILFFVVVWIFVLWGLAAMSKSHSWLLPILAVGLGAPRWAQMWWGVSGMASWLPWTNGYVASALVSRSLWLWLGLLDTLQNIGIGMILLSTMTRIHVAFTLISAQAAGSVMTAIARACAPNNVGPGPIFPNALIGISAIANGWFWIGLLLNLGICAGFFLFFRKEQLSKP
jgi:alpha-1,3-glucan synthase